MTKKFRTYSAAFKTEVVKKIADNNGNLNATARQLRIAAVKNSDKDAIQLAE